MKQQNLKRIIIMGLIVSILTLSQIRANAEWKQDLNGWWNTEGSSWSIGWRQIDGKWYYFGQDGYMVHDIIIDGYKLGPDGAWIQSTRNNLLNSGIDSKLDIICNNTKVIASSNPYEYIKDSQDYKDIVNLGDNALKYMLTKFESSKEDGLREYVMAIACSEILKENTKTKKWTTGREWYDNYTKIKK